MANETARLNVALLALPETTPATIYGLHEVFGAVGSTWSQITGEADLPVRRFRPVIASSQGRPFPSPCGPPVAVEAALHADDGYDVVIVTDLAVDLGADPTGHWREEAAWVRARFAAGAVVCSVCTGSVFLAEAGLLDGEEATTHWAAVPIFRDHYPRVRLRPERILCPAGAEHRIVTDQPVKDFTSATTADTTRYGLHFCQMLSQGIYLAPSQFEVAFISAAHTENDLEKLAKMTEWSFKKLLES